MKFEQGWLRNEDGIEKEIIVRSALPMEAKDLIIGGVLVGLGMIHLIISAFKEGSAAHERAEYETMKDLGIIKE